MSRHTPGPWTVDNWTYDNGRTIKPTITNGVDAVAQCLPLYRAENTDELSANAALIASSPELLEALERIKTLAESGVIQRNETGKPQWSLLDELKAITGAAIAKAKGGQV